MNFRVGQLVALSLTAALLVQAHKEGRGGKGDDSSDGDDDSRDGDYNNGNGRPFVTENCRCSTGRGRSTCGFNVGTRLIGCKDSNAYLQCVDTACTSLTCPANQVWNQTACASCPTGMHVRADLQRCACDQGTMPDKTCTGSACTKGCVACPGGATLEADRCFCPAGTVLDTNTNNCRQCPTNSTLRRDRCSCSDTNQFWSATAWQCLPCPGNWTTDPYPWWRRWFSWPRCTCSGINVIFNRRQVACVECPAGASKQVGYDDDQDTCLCPLRGQRYDDVTGTCLCGRGYTLNAAGTACEWTTTPAPTTTLRNNP